MSNQARALVITLLAVTLVAAGPRSMQVREISLTQHASNYAASLQRFFRVIDTKSRGYFSAADLVLPGYHITSPPVPFPQAQLQAPFRCVDGNRDGKISEREYVGYGVRAFDASNINGFLDPVKFAHTISPKSGCN